MNNYASSSNKFQSMYLSNNDTFFISMKQNEDSRLMINPLDQLKTNT